MADDKSNTGRADDTRINVHQKYEVDYWPKKLGCSEAQLTAAVKAVGVMVVDVRKYLGK